MTDLPDFPNEARKAADEGRLIVFLGAGISCAAGLPSWNEVKERMIKECRLLPEDDKNIKKEWENTDFYECFRSIKLRDETMYKKVIEKSIDTSKADISLYKKWIKIINSWRPTGIITTNVDKLLINSRIFSDSDYRYPNNFNPQEIREKKIFFLHGIGEDSIWNYDEQNDLYGRQDYKVFLWNIFGSYCVLFIGCSLKDKWVEYTNINKSSLKSCFHFALFPSCEEINQNTLLEINKIKILNYKNDDNKYQKFKLTIESWNADKPSVIEPDIAITGSSSP